VVDSTRLVSGAVGMAPKEVFNDDGSSGVPATSELVTDTDPFCTGLVAVGVRNSRYVEHST
jgi:hypothetical protein